MREKKRKRNRICSVFKVKIWFQNHRYKTKKQAKEREKLDAKQYRKDHPHHHQHHPSVANTGTVVPSYHPQSHPYR